MKTLACQKFLTLLPPNYEPIELVECHREEVLAEENPKIKEADSENILLQINNITIIIIKSTLEMNNKETRVSSCTLIDKSATCNERPIKYRVNTRMKIAGRITA